MTIPPLWSILGYNRILLITQMNIITKSFFFYTSILDHDLVIFDVPTEKKGVQITHLNTIHIIL